MQEENLLQQFYNVQLPQYNIRNKFGSVPLSTIKSNLKLILQIATKSKLKQGQDKREQSKQIFYCKMHGKGCFEIEVCFAESGFYKVLTDYTNVKHVNGCQVKDEEADTLKVYNMMMLKKGMFSEFMDKFNYKSSTPQLILQKFSLKCFEQNKIQNQVYSSTDYFYYEQIKMVSNRRKLKKRFDNIVNISIKRKRSPERYCQERNFRRSMKCPRIRRDKGEEKIKIENFDIYDQQQDMEKNVVGERSREKSRLRESQGEREREREGRKFKRVKRRSIIQQQEEKQNLPFFNSDLQVVENQEIMQTIIKEQIKEEKNEQSQNDDNEQNQQQQIVVKRKECNNFDEDDNNLDNILTKKKNDTSTGRKRKQTNNENEEDNFLAVKTRNFDYLLDEGGISHHQNWGRLNHNNSPGDLFENILSNEDQNNEEENYYRDDFS